MTQEKETKTRKIKVKFVRKAGPKNSLVEWTDKGLPYRATVPGREDSYSKDVLEAGIPYGVRWEEVKVEADAEKLAKALYDNDIWTLEDVMANPQAVIGICMDVIGVNLSALLKFARPKKEAK
jgi:hypothetical protein